MLADALNRHDEHSALIQIEWKTQRPMFIGRGARGSGVTMERAIPRCSTTNSTGTGGGCRIESVFLGALRNQCKPAQYKAAPGHGG